MIIEDFKVRGATTGLGDPRQQATADSSICLGYAKLPHFSGICLGCRLFKTSLLPFHVPPLDPQFLTT
jgi:hypothetical protein